MALKDFNTILTRSLTGAVFVGIIIGALLFNSLAAFTVFFISMYICYNEYLNLIKKESSKPINILIEKISISFIYGFFYFLSINCINIYSISLISLFFILTAIIDLFNKKFKLNKLPHIIFGVIYIVFPFSLANILSHRTGEFNGTLLLAIFFLIWSNDSFAYLFGVTFGKHRIWERISPKKSWEGFIGGALSTITISYFGAKFLFPEMILEMVGLSFIVIIFGTFGDLFESQLKRLFGVKDSGFILPGHGGFLDRFDSFLFIIPIAILYLQLIA